MILLSSCSDLMTSLSDFEMLDLVGFDYSNTCLTFHLSLGTLKAASSIGAIRSK